MITCPWHGYRYDITTGQFLDDPSAKLATYRVELHDGEVHVFVPLIQRETVTLEMVNTPQNADGDRKLLENEFLTQEVRPGQIIRIHLKGESIAVYNINGKFYATQNACTHADGPLNEGTLEGTQIICPWHGSCFEVTNGQVLCGPANKPLRTYRVVIDHEIGRVEA